MQIGIQEYQPIWYTLTKMLQCIVSFTLKRCNLMLALSPTCLQHKPSAYLLATFSISEVGRTERQTDGRTDGRTDRQTDRRTLPSTLSPSLRGR